MRGMNGTNTLSGYHTYIRTTYWRKAAKTKKKRGRQKQKKPKRNMSRGNSLSDELDLSSVLGDTRAYLYSPVLG